jgi:hypothetical protein
MTTPTSTAANLDACSKSLPCRVFTLVLLVVCIQLTACRTEMLRTAEEKMKEDAADPQNRVKIVPGADVDEAKMVLRACGEPSIDRVLAVYNRDDNGPIRRMIYTGSQEVTLDFLPSLPLVRHSSTFNHAVLQPELPQGAVWLFDEGRVEHEELRTSKRLQAYLPCAAKALQR